MRMFMAACCVAGVLGAAAADARQSGSAASDGRDADRAEIKAHIGSIFQAFIDGDVQKIHDTHSDDWRGFLESSRTPIKGIDEYMKANGITWPTPPAPPASTAPTTPPAVPTNAPVGKPGYAMKDFDVQFYGPDLAVACFFGEFNRTSNGVTTTTNRLRIMDVYGRRNGHWIQVASHTIVDPAYLAERNATPIPAASIPAQFKQQVFAAREAVWRAYFSNDQATLEKMIPAETIAINESSDQWSDRAAILEGAKSFAASGGKLVRLEFPKTEMQVYASGSIITLYTTYEYELEVGGKRSTTSGRATEMFVRRGGQLLNVGWHLDKKP